MRNRSILTFIVLFSLLAWPALAQDSITARRLSADGLNAASWWLGKGLEQAAALEDAEQKAFFAEQLLLLQARCDPSSEPDVVLSALKDLQAVPDPPEVLAYTYSYLATAFAYNGKMDGYRKFIDMALEQADKSEADESKYNGRFEAFTRISQFEGAAEAIKHIEKLQNPRWRSEHYCDLITWKGSNLKPEESAELLRRAMEDAEKAKTGTDDTDRIYYNIARAFMKANRPNESWDWIDLVEGEGERAATITDLVVAFVKAKDLENQKKAMEKFEALQPKLGEMGVRLQAAMARDMHEASKESDWRAVLDKTLKDMDTVEPGDLRQPMLYSIAMAQIDCGDFDGAKATFNRFGADSMLESARYRLAIGMSKAGDHEGAERIVKRLRDEYTRYVAWEALFRTEAAAGREAHLRELFKDISANTDASSAVSGAISGIISQFDPAWDVEDLE